MVVVVAVAMLLGVLIGVMNHIQRGMQAFYGPGGILERQGAHTLECP